MSLRFLAFFTPALTLLALGSLISEFRHVSVLNVTPGGGEALTLFSNAYHGWQRDPITMLLLELLPDDLLGKYASSILYGIIAVGCGMWAACCTKNPITSSVGASFALVTLALYFGYDVVHIGGIAWLPWSIATLSLRERKYRLPLTLISVMLLIAAGGTVSYIVVPAFLFFLYEKQPNDFPVVFAAIILLLIGSHSLSPDIHVPSYPPTGHVVSDDGLPGHLRPLVSSSSSVPFIERKAVQEALFLPALLGLGALLFGFLISLWRQQHRALMFLCGAAILILLDTALPESGAVIAPLQVFRRVAPDLSWYSPGAPLLACLLIAIPFALHRFHTVFIFFVMSSYALITHGLVLGNLTDIESHKLVESLPKSHTAVTRVLSPSFQVVKRYHVSHSDLTNTPQKLKYQSIRGKPGVELFASPGSLSGKRKYRDGNPATRIRIGEGAQRGDEWLCLEFPSQLMVEGIRLLTGRFYSDFPRGLYMITGDSCSALEESREGGQRFIPWEGPLRYTPDGFPYFGSQSTVELRTPNHPRAVRIQQTESAPFDWSVSEVELAVLGGHEDGES